MCTREAYLCNFYGLSYFKVILRIRSSAAFLSFLKVGFGFGTLWNWVIQCTLQILSDVFRYCACWRQCLCRSYGKRKVTKALNFKKKIINLEDGVVFFFFLSEMHPLQLFVLILTLTTLQNPTESLWQICLWKTDCKPPEKYFKNGSESHIGCWTVLKTLSCSIDQSSVLMPYSGTGYMLVQLIDFKV